MFGVLIEEYLWHHQYLGKGRGGRNLAVMWASSLSQLLKEALELKWFIRVFQCCIKMAKWLCFFYPLPQSVTLYGSPTKGHDLGKRLSCVQLRIFWKDKQLHALGNKPSFLNGGSSCPPHTLYFSFFSFLLLTHSFSKYQSVFAMCQAQSEVLGV